MGVALFGLAPSEARATRRSSGFFRASSGRVKPPTLASPAHHESQAHQEKRPSSSGQNHCSAGPCGTNACTSEKAPATTHEEQGEQPRAAQEPEEVQRQRAYARFARAEKARQQAEQERRWKAYREKLAAERDKRETDEANRKTNGQQANAKARAKKRRGVRQMPASAGFNPKKATQSEKDAHYGRVLALEGKVTIRDIKARYRALAAQYHPDKVEHLGEKLRMLAELETRRINEAYAYFRQRYNF